LGRPAKFQPGHRIISALLFGGLPQLRIISVFLRGTVLPAGGIRDTISIKGGTQCFIEAPSAVMALTAALAVSIMGAAAHDDPNIRWKGQWRRAPGPHHLG